MRWSDGECDPSLSLKVIGRNDVMSILRLACGGGVAWVAVLISLGGYAVYGKYI